MRVGHVARLWFHGVLDSYSSGVSDFQLCRTPLRVHFDLDEKVAKKEENPLPAEATRREPPELNQIYAGFEQNMNRELFSARNLDVSYECCTNTNPSPPPSRILDLLYYINFSAIHSVHSIFYIPPTTKRL